MESDCEVSYDPDEVETLFAGPLGTITPWQRSWLDEAAAV